MLMILNGSLHKLVKVKSNQQQLSELFVEPMPIQFLKSLAVVLIICSGRMKVALCWSEDMNIKFVKYYREPKLMSMGSVQ